MNHRDWYKQLKPTTLEVPAYLTYRAMHLGMRYDMPEDEATVLLALAGLQHQCCFEHNESGANRAQQWMDWYFLRHGWAPQACIIKATIRESPLA